MLLFLNSDYFQNLIDGFPEGVVIFNTDGLAYASNVRARQIMGCSAETLNGARWDELFKDLEDLQSFREYMESAIAAQRALAKGVSRDSLEVLCHCGGAPRHLSLTTSLLEEYDKVFGILLSMTDVSHIYAMHAREREFLEEKHALERERNESLAQLSDAVAHQLRNPAMTIAGFARILLRKADAGSTQQEFLEGILESSQRLEFIVQAVSSYNAIRAAKPRRVEFGEIVACAWEYAVAKGPEAWRACPIILDKAASELVLWVDYDLACSLFAEVFANALEAMLPVADDQEQAEAPSAQASSTNGEPPDAGDADADALPPRAARRPALRLEATPHGEEVALRVRDHGPGVGAAILSYVFDPFFTTKPVGVGMGLTRAHRMASELGGELTLANAPEGGCVVTLTLPGSVVDGG